MFKVFMGIIKESSSAMRGSNIIMLFVWCALAYVLEVVALKSYELLCAYGSYCYRGILLQCQCSPATFICIIPCCWLGVLCWVMYAKKIAVKRKLFVVLVAFVVLLLWVGCCVRIPIIMEEDIKNIPVENWPCFSVRPNGF